MGYLNQPRRRLKPKAPQKVVKRPTKKVTVRDNKSPRNEKMPPGGVPELVPLELDVPLEPELPLVPEVPLELAPDVPLEPELPLVPEVPLELAPDVPLELDVPLEPELSSSPSAAKAILGYSSGVWYSAPPHIARPPANSAAPTARRAVVADDRSGNCAAWRGLGGLLRPVLNFDLLLIAVPPARPLCGDVS
jgi:hypothetical protein